MDLLLFTYLGIGVVIAICTAPHSRVTRVLYLITAYPIEGYREWRSMSKGSGSGRTRVGLGEALAYTTPTLTGVTRYGHTPTVGVQGRRTGRPRDEATE